MMHGAPFLLPPGDAVEILRDGNVSHHGGLLGWSSSRSTDLSRYSNAMLEVDTNVVVSCKIYGDNKRVVKCICCSSLTARVKGN